MKLQVTAIWASRILRWFFGTLFIGAGVYYINDGSWPLIVFGIIFFMTGFLRPKRCIDENCEIE